MTSETTYYNEVDPNAAQWLRNLIASGLIPVGTVDQRSITDLQPSDLAGYTQCHFFAGIGGWAYACELAGWPNDRAIWTGSCPCQPFSVAGRRGGKKDARHLWPDFLRLIRACRPPVVMGEQVAGQAGYGWFDGVCADLAAEDYASRGVDIPACAVDSPHIRSRLYWIALADALRGRCEAGEQSDTVAGAGEGKSWPGHPFALSFAGGDGGLADRDGDGRPARTCECGAGCEVERNLSAARNGSILGNAHGSGSQRLAERFEYAASKLTTPKRTNDRNGSFWSDAEWIECHDGKARRAQPGIPLLAHGVSGRVAKWRGLGNAIVPQLAAEVIAAFMETQP